MLIRQEVCASFEPLVSRQLSSRPSSSALRTCGDRNSGWLGRLSCTLGFERLPDDRHSGWLFDRICRECRWSHCRSRNRRYGTSRRTSGHKVASCGKASHNGESNPHNMFEGSREAHQVVSFHKDNALQNLPSMDSVMLALPGDDMPLNTCEYHSRNCARRADRT
jgi:hypothetical protein